MFRVEGLGFAFADDRGFVVLFAELGVGHGELGASPLPAVVSVAA